MSYQAGSGLRPAMDSGSVMFSCAVSVGTRLKAWKTKPTWSRRNAVRALSDNPASAVSPICTVPLVAVSRAARQCMSVDLPEPERPITAANWPRQKSTETSSSARTSVCPAP